MVCFELVLSFSACKRASDASKSGDLNFSETLYETIKLLGKAGIWSNNTDVGNLAGNQSLVKSLHNAKRLQHRCFVILQFLPLGTWLSVWSALILRCLVCQWTWSYRLPGISDRSWFAYFSWIFWFLCIILLELVRQSYKWPSEWGVCRWAGEFKR